MRNFRPLIILDHTTRAMSLIQAQHQFVEILRGVKDEKEKINFLKWIRTTWDVDDAPADHDRGIKILESIAEDLRSVLPVDAVLPTENIIVPVCGPNSDCDPSTTAHVDEFLYNDEYIDQLVEEGKMSRHYCTNCLSRSIKPLSFITHSMSADRIQFLFTSMVPPLDNKTVLDVGSRLGAVLYGAHLFSTSPKIIGVEINKDLCKLQRDIIQKYKFNDRVEVIYSSVFSIIDILSSADVVILNNVFEFFTDKDTCIASWKLLAQHIKPRAIIVTIPHLSVTFEHLKVGFDWREWVQELPLCDMKQNSDWESHSEIMQHYEVKGRLNVI